MTVPDEKQDDEVEDVEANEPSSRSSSVHNSSIRDSDNKHQNETSAPPLEYPEPFYDSRTGKLLQDPVVDSHGDSYEKTTGSADDFSNRALKDAMQEYFGLHRIEKDHSLRGNLRRVDYTIQNSWRQLVDQSAFRTGSYRPLPQAYYCPILSEIMTDPVVTREGVTYERAAIEHWVRTNHTSPMTRQALQLPADIRPNNAIYDLIQWEKDGRPTTSPSFAAYSMHPSIRRWRESGAASTRPDPALLTTEGATTPAATTIPTQNLPTTHEEIEEMSRSTRIGIQVLICCTAIVLVLFFPFGFYVLLVFICLCKCYSDDIRSDD